MLYEIKRKEVNTMKKIGLLVMALAAVAVLGVAAYAAEAPAPKAAPVKKAAVKLMTAKGAITVVDEKAGTFSLKEDKAVAGAADMVFTAKPAVIKKITVGEKVTVGYNTLASGENHAVYVTPVKVKKVSKAAVKK
jgi:hypothetical protein